MSYTDLKAGLRSVAFTTAVPFSDDRRDVQYEAYETNLEAIEAANGSLFIPCGNTGEYYSLTRDERIGVVESTVDAVAGDSTVVAGAAGSTKNIVDLARTYDELGVDGIMIMHPDHTYLHEEGVKRYYRDIAARTDLGVVMYKRGPELSDDAIASLSTVENIVGVKYAVNDIQAFSHLVDRVDDEFVCINGIAERFAPSFALEGAEGFTTGIGNFAPAASMALHEAIEAGDFERARRIRNHIRPYENLRAESGPNNPFAAANNVPAVKYGMDLAGLVGGPVREPLVDLSDSDKERAETYYTRIVDSGYA